LADAVILLVLAIAILWGLRRGLIRPLIGEAAFLIAIALSVQFHSVFEVLAPKAIPRFMVGFLSVIVLSFAIGFAAKPLATMLRALPVVRDLDIVAGTILHGLIALILLYLAVGAIIDFDSHVYPMVASGNVTIDQVNDYQKLILSNPVTRAYAGGEKIDEALKQMDKQPNHSMPLTQFQKLAQILDFYVNDVREPMLHSRLAPIINNVGGHIPLIGHPRPYLAGASTAARRGPGTAAAL
jgi:uncharacterized membrane protein required for colicin V production